MTKYHRNNILKSVKKTSKRVLPTIVKGFKTVKTTAKDVAEVSVPVVEKGVSAVYGTMATGFDLGIKGVRRVGNDAKGMTKGMTKSKRSRRNKKGGRKTRRRH